jgi:hypothetical protein
MGMLCAGSVSRIRLLGVNLKERKDLEKLDIDGRITLKGILNRLRERGLDLCDLRQGQLEGFREHN